jgi:hypothetical protein
MVVIDMPIADFPQFSKLSLSHKDQIESITKNYEPYSDFNFTSLFSWDDGTSEVSLLHENLVIKLSDYITGEPVYSLLGETGVDASLDTLLASYGTVKLVPEVTVNSLANPEKYVIEEDRDNFDYVYALDILSRLPGGDFKKKRNKSHGFARSFPGDSLVVRAQPLTEARAEDVRRIFHSWAHTPSKSIEEIEAEQKAVTRLVDSCAAFELYLVEILLNDQAIAFSINEKLPNDYALCHFEKALPEYHSGNIYTYLSQQVAIKLLGFGCSRVNWEQDLGLSGLRKSKLSYHPATFLKKYSVTAKPNAAS